MHSDSENVIKKEDVISSSMEYSKLDSGFIEQNQLSGYDVEILKSSLQNPGGQTDFQSRHFVANSQITPYKKVRQALMELEVRHHAYIEVRTSLRKAEVLDRKFARDIQTCNEMGDEISAEMIQIDRDKNWYDIGIWQRKLKQAENEIKCYLDIIKEHAPDEESLKYFTTDNEEEERNYWVLRMGKQAAMDMISFGRLGSGNMDSIAMMDKEDQVEVLTIASQYAGMVNAKMGEITNMVQNQIESLVNNNQLQLPLIEEGLEEEAKNVFSAIESKVDGERIPQLSAVPTEE